ncbi:MAG TPA: hypothetical protein ENI27_07435 [bacterium]|nr:hypothetical protein [bacterium]
MNKKARRCGSRCHKAKGTRCKCWCGGHFHGASGPGPINRAKMENGHPEILRKHGFKKGKTTYISQLTFPGGME